MSQQHWVHCGAGLAGSFAPGDEQVFFCGAYAPWSVVEEVAARDLPHMRDGDCVHAPHKYAEHGRIELARRLINLRDNPPPPYVPVAPQGDPGVVDY